MELIDANRCNDVEDREFQKHHIIPKSLGGENEKNNIVGLSPKDHVKAHELLFRHFMFCAENMARAYASMVGSENSEFKDADSLADEYGSQLRRAYNVMRKRSVYSVEDMSVRRIGFFEKTPDGYVEIPERSKKTRERTRIFNVGNGKIFFKWPSNAEIPQGWKAAKDMNDAEKRLFPNVFGKREFQAYDPATLAFGKFKKGQIPEGWIILDISNPVWLLREKRKILERALPNVMNDAVKAAHERQIAEIDALEARHLSDPGLKMFPDQSELYGLYSKDGLYLTLNKWCGRLGAPYRTVFKRMFLYGMSFAEAFEKLPSAEAYRRMKGLRTRPVKRGHTEAFLKKRAARLEKLELRKKARLEEMRFREEDLNAKLAEFNSLGWGGFMDKYGERRGRKIYGRLKKRFPESVVSRKRIPPAF